ncbi:MAG TPA: flavin reductase family protein [Thermomicrobiales bacterium]|jgi:flavin reductase (DIM6/NTAB) family NADH-FMN oxidoreductase RutF
MPAQTDSYFYEPASGHGLPHDPFKAIVAPRPIGWIATRDRQGRANLAPYSFFNAFSSAPPIIGFSSEGHKDSVSNAEATGEFVANFVSRSLAEAMNRTSAPVGPEIDEMQLAGLDAAPCRLVAAPRVAAAPAALECKLLQVVRLRDLAGKELESYLVLGQVVGVHIDPRYLRDGRFDIAAAQPIMRTGYRADYAEIGGIFEMFRPTS